MANGLSVLAGSCTAIALQLDEPMAGTSPSARGVLAVEDPGPWGPTVPGGSTWLPEDAAAALGRAAAAAGVRIQLIRRFGRRDRDHRSHTVLLAHTGTGTPWLERRDVTDPSELLTLDLAGLARGLQGLGRPDARRHLLVCTHGQRDRCCARSGRELAGALQGLPRDNRWELWETTHTGGHRFAPNVLVIPSGVLYGRVDVAEAADLVRSTIADRVMIDRLRGRLALGVREQVADAEARRRTGADRLDAVSVTVVAEDCDTADVHVVVDGLLLRMQIDRGPTGRLRPVSCHGEPSDPGAFRVRGVAIGRR